MQPERLAARDLIGVGLAPEQESFVKSTWLESHDTQVLRTGGGNREAFTGAWWPTSKRDAQEQEMNAASNHTPHTYRKYRVLEHLPDYAPECMVLPWARDQRAEEIIGDHRFKAQDGLVSIFSVSTSLLRLARVLDGSLNWWWLGTVGSRKEAADEAERVRLKHLISSEHFYHYVIGDDVSLANRGEG